MQTDLSKRLISAYGAFDNKTRSVVDVNAGDIVRDLVLFDTVIIETVRLTEFPALVKAFGIDGLSALLDSGRLKIHCHSTTFIQSGQSTFTELRAKRGPLPLGHYSFGAIRAGDYEQYIHTCLQELNKTDAPLKHVIRLKRSVVDSLLPLPPNDGEKAVNQLEIDLRAGAPMVHSAITMALRNEFGVESLTVPLELHVNEVAEHDFSISTNLGSVGFNEPNIHKMVERGVLGLGGFHQRISDMESFSALSGFIEKECPLFEDRLGFLLRTVDPQPLRRSFSRVVQISEVPEFIPSIDTLDVERLLTILNSSECREFREWIRSIGHSTDAEISARIHGIRARLGSAIQTRIGKTVRFVMSAGLGVVAAGPGIAASALDCFILDRVLPTSGIYTFISSMYPSIFKKRYDDA